MAGPAAGHGSRSGQGRRISRPPVAFDVIIETPRGSRNRYEYDTAAGRIRLDRRLFFATVFPTDLGFVPGSRAPRGGPLTALVAVLEPTVPGCVIAVRTIGLLRGRDQDGQHNKLLCMPADEPRWAHVGEVAQLPPAMLAEIEHFFRIYEQIEPGRCSSVIGWGDRQQAETTLRACRDRHGRSPRTSPPPATGTRSQSRPAPFGMG